MYEIDAVGEGAAAAAPVAAATTPAPASSSAVTGSTSHGNKRQPRIKFIGKRSREKVQHATTPVATTATPATKSVAAKPVKNHHPSSKDFFEVKDKAWHGRPKLSAAEILAIESGGAY